MWPRWGLRITLVGAGLLIVQDALALRCDRGLVTEGDAKISVIHKCGEPYWIDRWFEEIVRFPDSDLEHRVSRVNERWIYNRGPTEFLRIVTIKDGKVSKLETGGRGFTEFTARQGCDFNTLSLAVTAVEVAARCGEPDQREQRMETVTDTVAGGRRQVTFSVEDWTYNLGPTRFMRILTFRNGDLVRINTGDKGFTP